MTDRSSTRRRLLQAGLAAAALPSLPRAGAAQAPAARLIGAPLEVQVALPDAERGYYRGTRFDWSGMITDLRFQGHRFYGPWFQQARAGIRDFIFEEGRIVAGPASAATGPADEFLGVGTEPAPGHHAAGPGGVFLKPGVGLLRRPARGEYDRFSPAEVADPGKWEVRTEPQAVTFVHRLDDPASRFGYRYRKQLRVDTERPRLTIEYQLANTGTVPLQGEVYNHNFLVLDGRPPGPGWRIVLPFAVQLEPGLPAARQALEVRGREIRYREELRGTAVAAAGLRGFGNSAGDYDLRVEHTGLGAGYRVRGTRPLLRLALWSIRTTLCLEPFLAYSLPPGQQQNWRLTYDYFARGTPRR